MFYVKVEVVETKQEERTDAPTKCSSSCVKDDAMFDTLDETKKFLEDFIARFFKE